jgi:hypothetical protein
MGDDSDFVGAAFQGFGDGLAQGMDVMYKKQAAEAKMKIEQEKLQMSRESHQMKIQKFAWDSVDNAYKYGGKDPVSGKVIPREESEKYIGDILKKQQIRGNSLNMRMKELQINKMLREGKSGIKLSQKDLQEMNDSHVIVRMLDNMAKQIHREGEASFGYMAALKGTEANRALGELGKFTGLFDGQELIDEHDRIVGVKSKYNIGAQILTRIFEQRITDKDRAFYLKHMASVIDNPAAALNKIKAIKQLFAIKYNTFRGSLINRGASEEAIGAEISGGLNLTGDIADYSDIVKNSTGTSFDPKSFRRK